MTTLEASLGRLALVFAAGLNLLAFAGDAVRPGEPEVQPPTFHNLGLVWPLEGDDNRNAACQVRFREKGGPDWKPAQPLLRVEVAKHPEYGVEYGNLLAGSVFRLEADREYEIQLELTDPDGGGTTRTLVARTRREPVLEGPGVKILEPGTYEASALVFTDGEEGRLAGYRGADRDKVVIRGEVNLSNRKHVLLRNVTVEGDPDRRGKGVSLSGSTGVVVSGCRVTAGYIGLYAANARDACIEDNEIAMRADWSGQGRPAEGGYGISLYGQGCVIRRNRIADCWDGISLAGDDAERRTCSIDIHENELERCVDDGIECDYVRNNIRVYRNRLTNVLCALSAQPAFGGPVYFLFNDIYNCRGKPFKFHVQPSGLIACHNTSLASGNAWSGGEWSNGLIFNNLILGAPGFPTVSTTARRARVECNGFSGDDLKFGKEPPPDVKLEHAVKVTPEIFELAPPPHPGQGYKEGYGQAYPVAARDFRLKPGSPAEDAGLVLPNLNDGFAGKAPDLGCYERGSEPPRYGPQP
ncbi:MAG: right-handed parallel beta-helix repeat-containing protein [Planctomycetota bacterium]|nr:right-handed parallel beta-helix repeat-containing protein [Planctomycetota bacterium]